MAHTGMPRHRAPSLCATPASPSSWGHGHQPSPLHPLSRPRDKSRATSPTLSYLHQIPPAKGEAGAFLLRRVPQRGRLEQEMGPVPIYTSTAPEPEPSCPSAAALCMQFHKRHLTKPSFLPYLHKSGAANTTQGITQRSPMVKQPHVPTQHHCAATILQVLVPTL